MAKNIDRILVVRTDRIGDVILTLPMAHVLKKNFPSSHVAMLIREYTAELVRLDPRVDEVLCDDAGGRALALGRLVAMLRRGRYDVVCHTHPRFRLALATWLAGIPVRVGTGYRWYSFLFNRRVYEHRKDARQHELEYNLNLLREVGCTFSYAQESPRFDVPADAAGTVDALMAARGVGAERRLILLHPGSGGSARDWPPENFGLLGRRLAALDGVAVMLTGGDGEEPMLRRVQEIAGPSALVLDRRLRLTEFAALARRAALFVANSTGMLHLAAAVGTPVIGLYSQLTPLSAARWGPYTDRKIIFVPRDKPAGCTECAARNGVPCPCMNSIPVDDVMEAAVRMLGSAVGAPEEVQQRG